MTISILKAEPFYPLGKPLPRPVSDLVKKVDEMIRPGIWRKPDGTMETRGYETPKPKIGIDHAGGTDSTVVATYCDGKLQEVVSTSAAPAAALGDGWIRHDGSRKCPIPNAEDGEYEVRWSDGSVDRSGQAVDWRWLYEADCSINLVAYRLIPTEAA
jgi:hypothetical protein